MPHPRPPPHHIISLFYSSQFGRRTKRNETKRQLLELRSPIDEFNKTQSWINVMKMGCYVAQTFVGDAILVSLILEP